MDKSTAAMAAQIAAAASAYQKQCTGHEPKAVSVVLSDDTLVITLHEALSSAEQALAKNAGGATQVQEFQRQLFASSSEPLRQDIMRITGKQIREATAEIEPATGAVVHAFTTGTVVQVYLFKGGPTAEVGGDTGPEHHS